MLRPNARGFPSGRNYPQHCDEAILVWWPRCRLDTKVRSEQRRAERSCDAHGLLGVAISEEINVLRDTIHDAVGEHSSTAGQSNGAGFGQRCRNLQYLRVQWIERHLGNRPGCVDERVPGLTQPRRQIQLVPIPDQLPPIDEFSHIVKVAFT